MAAKTYHMFIGDKWVDVVWRRQGQRLQSLWRAGRPRRVHRIALDQRLANETDLPVNIEWWSQRLQTLGFQRLETLTPHKNNP